MMAWVSVDVSRATQRPASRCVPNSSYARLTTRLESRAWVIMCTKKATARARIATVTMERNIR
ncbi:MAG: hypothetical protein HC898_01900 [Phycisphaerales bacterium]|nr:hypothetical protein [Phycisphaerales bacterium]